MSSEYDDAATKKKKYNVDTCTHSPREITHVSNFVYVTIDALFFECNAYEFNLFDPNMVAYTNK